MEFSVYIIVFCKCAQMCCNAGMHKMYTAIHKHNVVQVGDVGTDARYFVFTTTRWKL